MNVEFTISAINTKTITSLAVACVIMVAVIVGISYLIGSKHTQPAMLKLSIVLAMACAGIVFWHLAALRASVDADTFTIGGGLYRRTIALDQVERAEVRRWSKEDAGWKPKWRSNGIAMPGLALGWFTSKQSTIFAAITDWQRVVLIPTTDGYTILASPDDPDGLVAALRAP